MTVAAQSEGRRRARSCCRDPKIQPHNPELRYLVRLVNSSDAVGSDRMNTLEKTEKPKFPPCAKHPPRDGN